MWRKDDTDTRRPTLRPFGDRLTQTADLAWGQCVADGNRNELMGGRGEVHILLLQPYCHTYEVELEIKSPRMARCPVRTGRPS